MAEFTKYPPNTFCWPELNSTDAARVKPFYAGLFGWELRDDPIGPDQVYTMALLHGKSVGALYQMTEQQKGERHVPSSWNQYISVDEVQARYDRAIELGAKGVIPPMDVLDIGRTAMLADPRGARFALWQPLKRIGAELANEPGTFCWNELYTDDVDASGAFYTKVFGWSADSKDMGGGLVYTSFMNGERGAGGMMAIPKEWGDVPSHWNVYFAVDNFGDSLKKVEALGGVVRVPPKNMPEIGEFATVADPAGGAFGIIQLANAV